MSGNSPTSEMFCLMQSVSSRGALQVVVGSCGDSTQTLNQCSYMTYDNLSKSDRISPLPPPVAGRGTPQTSGQTATTITTAAGVLPGPGNVETF